MSLDQILDDMSLDEMSLDQILDDMSLDEMSSYDMYIDEMLGRNDKVKYY
jgi:hypothetical protein